MPRTEVATFCRLFCPSNKHSRSLIGGMEATGHEAEATFPKPKKTQQHQFSYACPIWNTPKPQS